MMAREMPTKTAKQFRDKRREPAYQRLRDEFLASAEAHPVGAPGSPGGGDPSPPPSPPGSPSSTDSSLEDLIQSPVRVEIERPGPSQGAGEVPAGGESPHPQASTRGVGSEGDDWQPGEDSGPVALPEAVAVTFVEPAHEVFQAENVGAHDAALPPPSPPAQAPPVFEGRGLLPEEEWRRGLLTHLRGWDLGDGPEGARVVSRAIRAAAWLPAVTQDIVDKVYGSLIEFLNATQDSDTPGRVPANNANRPRNPRSRRRAQKRYRYARTQELYKKDPGLLAKHVRLGTDFTVQSTQKLARTDIRDLYTALWGTRVPVRLEDFAEGPPIDLGLFPAIEVAEVRRRLGKIKSSTAGGPDTLRRAAISGRIQIKLLSGVYTLILASGHLPTAWSRNRTTLIPKEGKDNTKVVNYRPITISSLLSRLFWGIVDQRLRQVIAMNPRQKGFVAEAGCFANVRILDQLSRLMKTESGGVGVVLDVSKAFDTVPHGAIGHALRRKGVPAPLVGLVEKGYRAVYTQISHPEGDIEIELQRGVKQGDPLSPLLFNLVVEPLLERLETMPGFSLPEGQNISCLAFADDLLLVASDTPKAQALLDVTVGYFDRLGMSLSAPKSVAYQIVRTSDSWYLGDPGMEKQGEPIRAATADEALTYLGVRYSLWCGIELKSLRKGLTEVLGRVERLALKPHQKLDLVQRYLVPGYLHQLVIALPAISSLREIDQELRVSIKRMMHLPQSICNGVLYCRRGDGGLGFPRLEYLVPRVGLRLGLRFQSSPDPAVRALHGCASTTASLRRTANSVRINYPYTASDLRQFQRRCVRSELERWESLEAQGKAARSLRGDKAGNAFMYDPSLLKPSRFITALQLRTNTGGNRTTIHRYSPQQDLSCRGCGHRLETLAHILGECTSTKPARIKRHDEIVNLIESELLGKRGTEVCKEPRLHLEARGRLKPDLVVKNQDGVFVVDVTVRHEDGLYLERAREEKIDKYRGLLPQLQTRFGATSGDVLPIVVGTRGAMPLATKQCLKRLALGRIGIQKSMSLIALRSSIEMYHQFMDYRVFFPP